MFLLLLRKNIIENIFVQHHHITFLAFVNFTIYKEKQTSKQVIFIFIIHLPELWFICIFTHKN